MIRNIAMKKLKIILPIIVIVLSIGFVLFDSLNVSIEETINQDAATGSSFVVETMICKEKADDAILCVYETTNGRFAYATLKDSQTLFNRYSVCTLANIGDSALLEEKEIIENYDNMNMDFTYGIIFEPNSDSYEFNDESFKLKMCKYKDFNVGIFLINRKGNAY